MEQNSNADNRRARFFASIPSLFHGDLRDSAALQRTLISEQERFEEFSSKPLISLICFIKRTQNEFVSLLTSCQEQSYHHWRLYLVGAFDQPFPSWVKEDPRFLMVEAASWKEVINRVSGDYVGIVGDNGILHPQILGSFVRALQPGASLTPDILYCYESFFDETRKALAFKIKPGFEEATLLRQNYLGRLSLVKRGLLASAHSAECEHSALLEIAQKNPDLTVTVLPFFGYSSFISNLKQKDCKHVADFNVQTYLLNSEINTQWRVSSEPHGVFPSIRFNPRPGQDLGVIIPFRNQSGLTIACLESLERQKTTLSVRVLLINHQSDPSELEKIKFWISGEKKHVYQIISYNKCFNFAKINNEGAALLIPHVQFLMLLNNDVELLSEDAIEAMAGELDQHQKIAFVGIKLWYPGKSSVQHGGISFTAEGDPLGLFRAEHMQEPVEALHDEHTIPAITFACTMCRSVVWEKLGGLEEDLFPNGYGDVEICLRARMLGFQNFYLGSVEGIHAESKTRKPQNEMIERIFINKKYRNFLADPSFRALPIESSYHNAVSVTYPLRYRMVDALNNTLKSCFGDWHRMIKNRLSKLLDN